MGKYEKIQTFRLTKNKMHETAKMKNIRENGNGMKRYTRDNSKNASKRE